ncbi:unnamed protein product [Linum tenue]|uniref:Protein PHYTOCHROME KINASE SUBSTRATE 4 n=1 Tax=Linum tenue TaxID=586396 RepID=A0AAV0K254_9ROSI|nr:unnamed protein product [Linum tenue]
MRAIPGRRGGVESTPSPYFPFSQKLPPAVLDASFSSYLQPGSNPIDDSAEISIFDATKYFNSEAENPKLSISRVSPVVANGNSNNSGVVVSEPPRFSSASSSVDGYGYANRAYRTGSFHATPTASSEASWNSQTGLLSNPPGALAVSVRHPQGSVADDQRKRGSAKRWILGRRCPCSGKKSVQVEEKMSEPRTPMSHLAPNNRVTVSAMVKRQGSNSNDHSNNSIPKIPNSFPGRVEKSDCSSAPSSIDWMERREIEIPNSVRRISAETTRFGSHHRVVLPPNSTEGNSIGGGGGFTFPILSQSAAAAAPPVKLVLKPKLSILEDPPRESLEVFRPAEEVIVGGGNSAVKSRMTAAATDDDMASDASSDLFEIESFSTQTTSYQLNGSNRRDSMEDASTFNARRLSGIGGGGGGGAYRERVEEEEEENEEEAAATECYEPSEASIAWSVVTAEGFDRASVTNYSVTASEADEVRFMMMRQARNGGGGGGGGGKKRGGLLSCRCEKAVSVGPQPMRTGGGGEGQRGVNMAAGHVNGRSAAAAKPPLARSHSARLSLPFAA